MTVPEGPLISAIVSTKGRDISYIERMIRSLQAQTYQRFEMVVVDQNEDARGRSLEAFAATLPLKYIHTPHLNGISMGRNSGAAAASGEIIFFPDDDCWYPPDFLAIALEKIAGAKADVFTGRAADETGRTINGRSESFACRIDRANVWTTGIEWVTFFKKSSFDQLGGFDNEIGVGAASPWQSCEGQDIILRFLAKGLPCYYDPGLFGHHAEIDIYFPDAATCRKGRKYGRGLGYVMRIHGYSTLDAVKWLVRPCGRAVQSLFAGNMKRFNYFCNVALGRWEGWSGHLHGKA